MYLVYDFHNKYKLYYYTEAIVGGLFMRFVTAVACVRVGVLDSCV